MRRCLQSSLGEDLAKGVIHEIDPRAQELEQRVLLVARVHVVANVGQLHKFTTNAQ